jgi:hypothetical protein
VLQCTQVQRGGSGTAREAKAAIPPILSYSS